MKKSQHNSTVESGFSDAQLASALGENRFIQWISQHGITMLLSIIAALLALGIGYRLISGGSGKAEADYMNAENNFIIFKKGQESPGAPSPSEALIKLEQILKAHPELNSKYDGVVAQILINRGQLDRAKPFADRTLKRTGTDDLPLYADYAGTTLLICRGNYREALLKSLELKQKMVDDAGVNQQLATREFGGVLLAFNLLRIAMLEQQVGTPADELKAWQALKGSAKELKLLQEHFEEGKVSLMSYIEAREKNI